MRNRRAADPGPAGERLARLLTVKSIVTIVLTGVFSVLALRGTIESGQFLTVFTVIISFYFGSQVEKASQKRGE